MKTIINLWLLIIIIVPLNIFAQSAGKNSVPPLTKEQKHKDSIEFAKFKQNNPELFLNKRLPVKLTDESYVVLGYETNIRLEHNHIKDSVYHNFHPGMPDTSTLNPYNDIQLADAKVKIDLFAHLLLLGGKNDSAVITSVDSDLIVDNKIGKLPVDSFGANEIAIRISINGKLLFDWRTINNFAKNVFKASEYFKPSPNHVGSGVTLMFGYIWI